MQKLPKLKSRLCWRCNEEFHPSSNAQMYCGKDECREFATSDKYAGERFVVRQAKRMAMPNKGTRLCTYCGRRFVILRDDEDFCTPECKRRAHNNAMVQSESKYSRQCHDCGKPTNDYRCSACLAKWREKNHVSSGWSSEDAVIF